MNLKVHENFEIDYIWEKRKKKKEKRETYMIRWNIIIIE
jgi:hypothetical protein